MSFICLYLGTQVVHTNFVLQSYIQICIWLRNMDIISARILRLLLTNWYNLHFSMKINIVTDAIQLDIYYLLLLPLMEEHRPPTSILHPTLSRANLSICYWFFSCLLLIIDAVCSSAFLIFVSPQDSMLALTLWCFMISSMCVLFTYKVFS